jgi:hypothetical protein
VPLTQSFWNALFAAPKAAWGLRVYEQDWLFNEMVQYVGALTEDVLLARQWLLQMGAAAAQEGLCIQYCMPYLRFVLASLESPAVTQARASDDYMRESSGVPNWKIAGQSLLFDALGLASSKDGFWTTSAQPGNPYGATEIENFPLLQSAVATLSAGPVQIGDGIGFSNVSIILKSCRADGRLLQPSQAATPIDAAIRQAALRDGSGPTGEVWFAPSFVAGQTFGYLFVAELLQSWSLTRPDLPDLDPAIAYWAFEANASRPVKFSANASLPLPASVEGLFQYWRLVPIFSNGLALVGETDKWVSVAAARFEQIAATPTDLVVTVRGSAGERLFLTFLDRSGQLVQHECTITSLQVATISFATGCFAASPGYS